MRRAWHGDGLPSTEAVRRGWLRAIRDLQAAGVLVFIDGAYRPRDPELYRPWLAAAQLGGGPGLAG